MTVPDILVVLCFIVLMALGAFVLVYSLLRLTRRNAPSHLSLPGIKIELKGPAWLVSAVVGAVMLASPVLAAAFQTPDNVTAPPPPASVQHVRTVPEPNYDSFRFARDVSILDLRTITEAPWYAKLPGWPSISERPRIRPAILRNYMVVRKVGPANEIHLTYGTSGRLDVRCLTHQARYRRSEGTEGETATETWEVIADVGSIPVGQEFEIIVEATYWNAFRGDTGDDYTTYAHEQIDPENISIILLFPEDKPFKEIAVTEYAPEATTGSPFQGQARALPGPQNKTYYWTTTSQRPGWYYKVTWSW